MIPRFNDILQYKKKREELLKLESKLSEGRLTDYALLDDIYCLTNEHCAENDALTRKKIFLFIVILFFAPHTFSGARLPYGMRVVLGRFFDCNKSAISQYIGTLRILYLCYPDFRNEVERIYFIVEDRIINKF